MATELSTIEQPLFRRPGVIALLAATYLFVSVPYGWLMGVAPQSALAGAVTWVYWATLGLGHFFITLVLYFQSRNLRYFTSSRENLTIYFLIPGAFFIFTGLNLTFGLWGNEKALAFVAASTTVLRFLDFNHFAGQTFGVLQITKSHSGVAFARWQRNTERLFFLGAGVLQGETLFLSGNHIDLSNRFVLLTAAVTGLLFLAVLFQFFSTAIRGGSARAAWIPFGYFLVQFSCAIAAAINMNLYGAALAIHYVEYHILIDQRLAHARLDPSRWSDRCLGFFQRKPGFIVLVFMTFSTLMYAIWTRKLGLGPVFDQAPVALRFTYFMSNGIFFMHYFVESFVWKFQNSFFREDMQFLAVAGMKSPETRARAA